MDISRRGLFSFIVGAGAVATALPAPAIKQSSPALPATTSPQAGTVGVEPGDLARAALRLRVGPDTFDSWFHAMQFERFDGQTITVSVPVKFLRTWVEHHYRHDLLEACRVEFANARRVQIVLRYPASSRSRVI